MESMIYLCRSYCGEYRAAYFRSLIQVFENKFGEARGFALTPEPPLLTPFGDIILYIYTRNNEFEKKMKTRFVNPGFHYTFVFRKSSIFF